MHPQVGRSACQGGVRGKGGGRRVVRRADCRFSSAVAERSCTHKSCNQSLRSCGQGGWGDGGGDRGWGAGYRTEAAFRVGGGGVEARGKPYWCSVRLFSF